MEWLLTRPATVHPLAVALFAFFGLLALLVAWLGTRGLHFAGVGLAVLAPVFFAGLRLRHRGRTVKVRAEAGVIHLGEQRWPLDTLGWASAERGELTIFDLDGAILHSGRYTNEAELGELAAWIQAHRPSASEMAEQRARRAQVSAEARALLDRQARAE